MHKKGTILQQARQIRLFFYSPCNCLEKLGKFEIEELKMFRSPASGSAPISNQDDVTETERRFQIKK